MVLITARTYLQGRFDAAPRVLATSSGAGEDSAEQGQRSPSRERTRR